MPGEAIMPWPVIEVFNFKSLRALPSSTFELSFERNGECLTVHVRSLDLTMIEEHIKGARL